MKNICFINLGCSKNLSDSEEIIDVLTLHGFNIIHQYDAADMIIINTCGFVKEMKEQAIEEILKAVEYKKKFHAKLIVIGCLIERYQKELKKEIPEIDAFLGTEAKADILNVIKNIFPDVVFKKRKKTLRYRLSLPHIGYLKISEGCSHGCSFCSIPFIRGKYKSKPKEQVLSDLDDLILSGAKEIDVIAQDTTFYGRDIYDKNYRLSHLLEDISKKEKIKWIRLMYAHPKYLDDQTINLISQKEKFCNYIDVPIQHISNQILKKMKRGITKEQTISLIEKIKNKNIALRTTLLVGFPGETEKDFNELVDFVKDVKFDRLGVFKYSREEGTASYNYDNQIPEKIKEQRAKEIMRIQKNISKKKNIELLGSVMDVMIDTISQEDKNLFVGRTKQDAPDIDCVVYVPYKDKIFSGDIVKTKITEVFDYDLKGEMI